MALTEMRRGSKGKVVDLGSVSMLVRRRLCDLGVTEGAVVSVRKMLPFGGPCTIESNGQWIAIRRKEAQAMRVEAL
ncbi:FeoA family protein [Cohnella nanjingensis]|uniref:Ferrous iron transport protein A n=1 Tax=Cohnella nanjingensis TaxID=1387779 RepID=A0A7X0VG84_9BACL|nr:FeoA family protein [Cohnella nanjingensis]MBB6671394.1 ferrous iron transport protein A [Cohnella nanjingensis]